MYRFIAQEWYILGLRHRSLSKTEFSLPSRITVILSGFKVRLLGLIRCYLGGKLDLRIW
jgi:hypothetical protein